MLYKYVLGKCDWNGTGRKINLCEFEIRIHNGSGIPFTDPNSERVEYVQFSMSGVVWNATHTEVIGWGQNCDEIAEMFPNDKMAKRLVEFWERWHLSYMRPGCVHQMEAGWDKLRIDPVSGTGWYVNLKNANLQMWEREPIGVLQKPCPVCGYKFGTKWLVEPVPDEIIDEVLSIVNRK